MPITKDKQPWGMRLMVRPFEGTPLEVMEIHADVIKPVGAKASKIEVWFNGVPVQNKLRATDIPTWLTALREITEQAREIAKKFKKR